jgi:hypothetical protein
METLHKEIMGLDFDEIRTLDTALRFAIETLTEIAMDDIEETDKERIKKDIAKMEALCNRARDYLGDYMASIATDNIQ